ncbi:MAG: hypothetical protein Q9227_005019 [Pyrenula ochraceoflavens]
MDRPIVRIAPDEIHIDDPYFFDTIYTSAKGANKDHRSVYIGGALGSTFSAVDHQLHRLRRGPLNAFFAKRSVLGLEHVIKEKIEKFITHLDAVAGTGKVFQLDNELRAVTGDIITQYAFGHSDNLLDEEKPGLEWKEMMFGALQTGPLLRHFPWLLQPMKMTPLWLASVHPPVSKLLRWQADMRKHISAILAEGSAPQNKQTNLPGPTIFHTLRDCNLPAHERTLARLSDEAETITGAGTETTARTLFVIAFYVASNREIMQALKEELKSIPANSGLQQIEQLPYLTAVIKEGLRLSFSLTTRLPRVFNEDLRYKEWIIPAKTPVSSTIYLVLTNEEIFPSPFQFNPERWTKTNEGGQRLDRFLVPFGKGSRACVGIK